MLGLDLGRGVGAAAELPPGASDLLERRERARAAHDYATSDLLRGELAALGVRVTDTRDGQRWEVTPR